jgi:hypothetical protein
MRSKSFAMFVLIAVMLWLVSLTWSAPINPPILYSRAVKGMDSRSYSIPTCTIAIYTGLAAPGSCNIGVQYTDGVTLVCYDADGVLSPQSFNIICVGP